MRLSSRTIYWEGCLVYFYLGPLIFVSIYLLMYGRTLTQNSLLCKHYFLYNKIKLHLKHILYSRVVKVSFETVYFVSNYWGKLQKPRYTHELGVIEDKKNWWIRIHFYILRVYYVHEGGFYFTSRAINADVTQRFKTLHIVSIVLHRFCC